MLRRPLLSQCLTSITTAPPTTTTMSTSSACPRGLACVRLVGPRAGTIARDLAQMCGHPLEGDFLARVQNEPQGTC